VEAHLHRDVKEVIGALMRVLDGAEISESELADLDFEAEGELATAVDEAYLRLGEFAEALDVRQAIRIPIAGCGQSCKSVSTPLLTSATGRKPSANTETNMVSMPH